VEVPVFFPPPSSFPPPLPFFSSSAASPGGKSTIKLSDISQDFDWPSDKLSERNTIVDDFLLDESEYLSELLDIDEMFLFPLEDASFLSGNDKWTLVANLGNIIALHQNFLSHWKEKREQAMQFKISVGQLNLGPLVYESAQEFREYQLYCSNLVASENLFNKLMVFSDFLFSYPFTSSLSASVFFIKFYFCKADDEDEETQEFQNFVNDITHPMLGTVTFDGWLRKPLTHLSYYVKFYQRLLNG